MKCYACHGEGGKWLWCERLFNQIWQMCTVCRGKGYTK